MKTNSAVTELNAKQLKGSVRMHRHVQKSEFRVTALFAIDQKSTIGEQTVLLA